MPATAVTLAENKQHIKRARCSVGRCVIPCAFFGKSVKHIFSCSKMYPD